jgi:hypothetical protein
MYKNCSFHARNVISARLSHLLGLGISISFWRNRNWDGTAIAR